MDKYAVKSYNAIHGTEFDTSDITKIHPEDVMPKASEGYTVILTYSFPCTDLSVAGAQKGMSKGSGTRSGLLWEVERLLKEIDASEDYSLPDLLLMENVPQVCSPKNKEPWEEWLRFLESIGYVNAYQQMNAADHGIPQNRKRVFMLSWRNPEMTYEFPQPKELNLRMKDLLDEEVEEKYYMSDQAVEGLLRQMNKDHKPTLIDEQLREREQ